MRLWVPLMDWFVRAFLKASLVWLTLGVTLGVAMAAYPVWTIYRPAHMHVLMLGFVAMMIFGVAYHVIPRFAGFPLHSARAATAHWWVANASLVMIAAGFIVRPTYAGAGTVVLAVGGTLSAVGAYVFAYVIWRTLDGPAELREAARRARESVTKRTAARLPIA